MPQCEEYKNRDTAEKLIKYVVRSWTEENLDKRIWRLWNISKGTFYFFPTSAVVDAEGDHQNDHKWLDTVPDSNPASNNIVFRIQDGRVSGVIFVIVHESIARRMEGFR